MWLSPISPIAECKGNKKLLFKKKAVTRKILHVYLKVTIKVNLHDTDNFTTSLSNVKCKEINITIFIQKYYEKYIM